MDLPKHDQLKEASFSFLWHPLAGHAISFFEYGLTYSKYHRSTRFCLNIYLHNRFLHTKDMVDVSTEMNPATTVKRGQSSFRKCLKRCKFIFFMISGIN